MLITASIGLVGTRPKYKLMRGCDTLLIVGSSFPYSEWLPEEGQARCVQIDLDGSALAMRYAVDVPLVGDARETLRLLLPRLNRNDDGSFRKEIEDGVHAWRDVLERRAHEPADPLTRKAAFELSKRLPDFTILTADSGSSTVW